MQPYKKTRIAVFVSGGGSNLQAILKACSTTLESEAEVVWVMSNRQGAYALQRAQQHQIAADCINPKDFPSRQDYYNHVLTILQTKQVDLICLAGFLLKLEKNIIDAYRGKILNIHPSLLPKFGGKGMYGHFVHEAVLRQGELQSGCTVHLVTEELDEGEIIAQRKIDLQPGEDAATLGSRVLEQEHLLYPEAILLWKQRFVKGIPA